MKKLGRLDKIKAKADKSLDLAGKIVEALSSKKIKGVGVEVTPDTSPADFRVSDDGQYTAWGRYSDNGFTVLFYKNQGISCGAMTGRGLPLPNGSQ